jgi:hypothetical protein
MRIEIKQSEERINIYPVDENQFRNLKIQINSALNDPTNSKSVLYEDNGCDMVLPALFLKNSVIKYDLRPNLPISDF